MKAMFAMIVEKINID